MTTLQTSFAKPSEFFAKLLYTAQNDTEQSGKNIQAIAQTSSVLMRGFQDVSRHWVAMSRDCLQKNLEGLSVLGRCRSVPDIIAVQTSLIRGNLELTLKTAVELPSYLSVSLIRPHGRCTTRKRTLGPWLKRGKSPDRFGAFC